MYSSTIYTHTFAQSFLYSLAFWGITLLMTGPIVAGLIYRYPEIKLQRQELSVFVVPFWVHNSWFIINNNYSETFIITANILLFYPLVYFLGKYRRCRNSRCLQAPNFSQRLLILNLVVALCCIFCTAWGNIHVPLYE